MSDTDVFLWPGDPTDTTVILRESGLLITQISVSDTLALSCIDTSANFLTSGVSDTLAAALTESSQNVLTAAVLDTLAVTVNDTSAVLVVVNRADVLALALAESSSSLLVLSRDDVLQVTTTEASQNFITLQRSDTGALSIDESSANALSAALADTLALTLTETGFLYIYAFIVAADQLQLAVSESSTSQVSLERPEFCVLSLSEASDSYLTTLVADNLSTALVDAAVVIEPVTLITGSDVLVVTVVDGQVIGLNMVTSDELGVAITEDGVLIQETTVYVPVLEVAADTHVSDVEAHTSTTAVDAELVDQFVYVEYESATATASKVKVGY